MALFGKEERNTYVVNKKTAGAAIVEGILSKRSPETTEADVEKERVKLEGERARQEANVAEKREGLAAINAVDFDGDAKSIFKALSDLQILASAHGGNGESKTAIRKAAFQKIELGIRALRGAGDAGNAEYFEKKLKSMRTKAFLTSPLFMAVGAIAFFFILAGIFQVLGI
jgi:hypothetical protein